MNDYYVSKKRSASFWVTCGFARVCVRNAMEFIDSLLNIECPTKSTENCGLLNNTHAAKMNGCLCFSKIELKLVNIGVKC